MKTLIIYDSLYGNTEKIAEAIRDGVGINVTLLPVTKLNNEMLDNFELLVIGSPVHGGMPTSEMQYFLKTINPQQINGKKVATFDTRFALHDHGIGVKLLMSVIHYAAEKIAKDLSQKGAILITEPEGFIVKDKEGPLKEGEVNRAFEWGNKLTTLSLPS